MKKISAVFVVLCLINVMCLQGCSKEVDYSEMNKKELHYDADGWFVMIDEAAEVAGLYYGPTPLVHVKFRSCDSYSEYPHVTSIQELILDEKSDMTYLYTYLYLNDVPKETPVLIYR